MNQKEIELLFNAQDSHWWYLGMAAISKAILNRWYLSKDHLRILDAGCGTGSAIKSLLTNYGPVTGIDISLDALDYCRQTPIDNIVCATITNVPFKLQSFDLITCFDVLSDSGICNDRNACIELVRVLKIGGRIMIRLPAYGWLTSRHDNAVQTVRRYNKKQVYNLLTQSGLIVEYISYANMFLFPCAFLYRFASKLGNNESMNNSDLSIKFSLLNPLFFMVLRLEALLIKHIRFPYGLSVIAVGKKP